MKTDFYADKRVLITGCCGTIGACLLERLAALPVAEMTGVDNNESGLFALEERYGGRNFHFSFGDVRDAKRLEELFDGVDVVLHTAALKHVAPCELAPGEAVQTNILGVRNVIDAALRQGVGHVLFTSSDKAVNPTNVMGTTKLMGERLMTAAQIARHTSAGQHTVFASTRFGNVLGSHGSVFPLFCRQIARGGPVTLTDARMTRFVMTADEAVDMVLSSVVQACGGEVFVSKMRSLRIEDLAAVMVEELAPVFGHRPGDIEVRVIGSKAGEKLYEELLTEEESQRAVEMERMFAILPAFLDFYSNRVYQYPEQMPHRVEGKYRSDDCRPMTREDIVAYLNGSGLLAQALSEGRHG